MTPHVFIKPPSIVNIQLRYKERDENGRLQFKASQNITVTGWTLQEAMEKIIEALSEKEAP